MRNDYAASLCSDSLVATVGVGRAPGVTCFLGFHARHLQIDFSVENLLASDDPNKAYYDEIRTLFGSDDLAVIGLLTDNVYTPATLEKIRRITAQVEKLDGVQNVFSLTNIPDPIANVDEPPLLSRRFRRILKRSLPSVTKWKTTRSISS